MPVISIVHKDDVLNEAIKTKYYFDIRSILYAMDQDEAIGPNGNLYADNLKYRAAGRDCYDTVVNILGKLGVAGDMRNWIDNADSYICPRCGLEVNNPAKTDGRCPKCGFQDPRYGEMNNRRHLESLSDHELAVVLVEMCEGTTEEYDWEENPVEGYPYTYWRTSDGEDFLDYDDAVEHESWWLRQPYKKKRR